ncbi:MAG: hypothetical protein GY847_01300 [Proteobacteria bacterium]|nr:hypothetical protein [Pseudomonadota bacterium]
MSNKHTAKTLADQARKHASRLSHDVGKYISRTACNLMEDKVPKNLLDLFCVDLFEIDDSRTASELFEELSAPLEKLLKDNRLDKCRYLLNSIDAMEKEIRKGDDSAVRQAAAMAMEVNSLLKDITLELSEERD